MRDHAALIDAAHERGAQVVVAADILALTLLRPPGEIGADVVAGTHPALRRADGLRRPARRLPRRPAGPRAAAARPARRRERRRRRQPRPTGSRCRPASSTSAARRPPATSAPRRCCSRSSPRCTRSTTGRRACGRSRPARTGWPPCSPPGCGPAASTSCTTHFFDTVLVRVPGPRRRGRRQRARPRASTSAGSTPTTSAIACDETTTRDAPAPAVGGVRCRPADVDELDADTDDAYPGGAAPARRST